MNNISLDDFEGKAASGSLTERVSNEEKDLISNLANSNTPLAMEAATIFSNGRLDFKKAVENSDVKNKSLRAVFQKEANSMDLPFEETEAVDNHSLNCTDANDENPKKALTKSHLDAFGNTAEDNMIISRRVKVQNNQCKIFTSKENDYDSSLDEAFTSIFDSAETKTGNVASKPVNQSGAGSQGIQSLYQCAEALLSKVKMLIYQDNLYYYNGKSYSFLTQMDLIKLYRQCVDPTMGGEKSMTVLKQLHMFLLTSPTDKIRVVDEIPNLNIAVFNNGVYDIMNKEFKKHSPDTISFYHIDADYDKDAECPVFDKFLSDITRGDENQIKRIYEVIGYICSQNRNAKCFIFMGLAPNSGKSQLGGFIERLFAPENRSNVALSDFNTNFGLSNILGSAVNVSLDLPNAKLNAKAVSRLKMLTGSDTIQIDKKFETPFSYRNRAVLVFASNHPIIAPHDDAFWDRCVYIPFEYTTPEDQRNIHLIEQLISEKNAIVSKSMKYVRKLIKNDFHFTTNDRIELKVAEWSGNRDKAIDSFLTCHCTTKDKQDRESVDYLYSQYELFCDNNGYTAQVKSDFKKYLIGKGFTHTKGRVPYEENPVSILKGIRICYTVEASMEHEAELFDKY